MNFTSFRFALALLITSALPAPRHVQPDNKPVYTVEAIRYGTIPDFPVNGLVAGADPSRKMDIAMIVWLIQV